MIQQRSHRKGGLNTDPSLAYAPSVAQSGLCVEAKQARRGGKPKAVLACRSREKAGDGIGAASRRYADIPARHVMFMIALVESCGCVVR